MVLGLSGTLPFALLIALGVRSASAQGTSDVVCMPSFGWANNSLEQNPCLVGAYLQAQCNGGAFAINQIAEGYHYIGPTNDTSTQNECVCSTPVYQLISACGACQNRTWIAWPSWSFYCPANLLSEGEGVFPSTIPAGTRVPAWAYIKPSDEVDSIFNITAARNVGDSPESTQVPSSTTSSISTTTFQTTTTGAGGGVLTVTVTSSGAVPPTSSSGGGGGGGGSNAGAIAGGVVGGVVGLALLALLGFFLLRRKRNHTDPAGASTGQGASPQMATYGAGAGAGSSSGGAYNGAPMASPAQEYPQSHYTGQTAPGAGPTSGYQPSGGYYNPNDPSTFARTPVQSAYTPTSAGGYGSGGYPQPQSFPGPQGPAGQGYYGEPHNTAGRYSGMPEV